MKFLNFPTDKKLLKNKRGVFGLTSVQQFFAVILAVALLAYVIVVIMGTLNSSTIIPSGTLLTQVNNESAFINSSGDAVNTATNAGFTNAVAIIVVNATDSSTIPGANYTLNATSGVLTNATAKNYPTVLISYTYYQDVPQRAQTTTILGNTSTGITQFFSAVNPVYAILAILVIILVLVVLVRVVTGGNAGERREPQL